MISERKELKEIHEKIDYKEFEKSLYGSILSFICIMTIVSSVPQISMKANALALLIDESYQLVSILNSYTDTLDILTNPKEWLF